MDMDASALGWAVLPDGLEPYFEITEVNKNDEVFHIVLVEKNIVPRELPEQYQGKRIINTVLNDITLEDFPIRGRKGTMTLRRRSWKFEGVGQLYKRDIPVNAENTKLVKEFALFLKGFH